MDDFQRIAQNDRIRELLSEAPEASVRHAERVAIVAVAAGAESGMDEEALYALRIAALLGTAYPDAPIESEPFLLEAFERAVVDEALAAHLWAAIEFCQSNGLDDSAPALAKLRTVELTEVEAQAVDSIEKVAPLIQPIALPEGP